MNKIARTAGLMFLCVSLASAVEIKPNIGYSFLLSDTGSSGVTESQEKGGVNGNLGVLTKINSNLRVGAEIGFIPIYKWNYSLASGSNIKLTYDTIPVLLAAEYTINETDLLAPYAMFKCGIFVTGLKTVSNVAGIQITSDSSKNHSKSFQLANKQSMRLE